MHAFLKDIKHGLKMMRKRPGVAAIVILSIALGVSVNAAVYSWIESIVLNPLPSVPDGDRLVTFVTRTQAGEQITSSYLDYEDFEEQTKNLEGPAAFEERPLSLGQNGQTERVWAMLVTGNFFDVLGIQPALGNFFLPENQVDTPGAHQVAVISHDFWESHFDAQPSVVGKPLSLNRQLFTVIGVAPRGFRGTVVGLSFDVWVPVQLHHTLLGGDPEWINIRQWRSLHAIARLRPGVGNEDAQAELDVVASRLAETHPDANEGIGAAVMPLSESPYGAQSLLGQQLNLLLLAGVAVLLIVAANLASLLLAQAVSREREIGIRQAFGAGRGRLFRQLMTESLVFALAAAVLSLVFVIGLSDLLKYFVPPTNLPVWLTPRLSFGVVLISVLLSVLTGLAAGLAPAWRSATTDLRAALSEGGRGRSASRRKKWLQGGLVAAEVALALVALMGAGVLMKSFRNVSRIDPGFDDKQVLLVALTPSAPDLGVDEIKAHYRRVKQRLQELPFVRAVSYAEHVPMGFKGGSWEEIEVNGYTPRPEESMNVYRNLVEDDYFDVMRIPLVDGRFFTDQDRGDSQTVAIVNETFVRRFMGSRLAVGNELRGWGRTLNVVGVVKDSKYASATEAPIPYLYVPFRQLSSGGGEVVMHVSVNDDVPPEGMMAAVRTEVDSSSSVASISYAMSLREYTDAALFKHKISAILLAVLGGTALILAALGIYGVMSHSVTQRMPEIGVRMAVGAVRTNIFGLIVSHGFRLSLLGLFLGILASVAVSRLWASLIYGVGALDLGTVFSSAFVIVAFALFASVVPAYRATKINPLEVLPSG